MVKVTKAILHGKLHFWCGDVILGQNIFKTWCLNYNILLIFCQFHYVLYEYTLFFISKNFITNASLKLAKNQANAKQHSEAELLPFENYSQSSSTFFITFFIHHPKILVHILKNKQKKKYVCKMKMKMKNRSHR